MSGASTTASKSRLRRDLSSVIYHGKGRDQRVVIDEVSGQFTRTAEHAWQALIAGTADELLWRQADAAGWTRSRHGQHSGPRQSALAFRIPLGTIDPLARRLVACSGFLFSPIAVACWAIVILVAAALCLSHSVELASALTHLPTFLTTSDAFWIGAIFVGTKVLHELAHGVVCRRVGGRVGDVGILLLCGIPCPYCDVTDIWRQPSSLRRAAVMLAGIYVELIVASLALFIWLSSNDAALRFHMLNLMIVCGVSTIVFNANPLMRYDGYFVLADCLRSVNLRREAQVAFSSVVTARIAGPDFASPTASCRRSLGLSCYHTLSTAYRFIVLVSIATMALGIAQKFHLRPLAALLVAFGAAFLSFRLLKRLSGVIRGKDAWKGVSSYRRVVVTLVFVVLLLGVAFIPTRRYRRVTGWIDSADAIVVYLGNEGVISNVGVDFGAQVRAGDQLVEIENSDLQLQAVKLKGRLDLATLRRDQSRRGSLEVTSRDRSLETFEVARAELQTQLVSVQTRLQDTEVKSPLSGTVIPATSTRKSKDIVRLRDRLGTIVEAHDAWCRVSPEGKLHAVLELDARDRLRTEVGTRVRISPVDKSGSTHSARVASISQLRSDDQSITREAKFRVLCPLDLSPSDDLIGWLGRECHTIVELPSRSLASDAYRWAWQWLGGE